MKNYLVISLLIFSFGFPQKMLNKKDMVEEKLPDSDEIIVYPPNTEDPFSGVVYWYGGLAHLNHQPYNDVIKNGPYTEWSVLGKKKILRLTGNYKNGAHAGLCTYFSENKNANPLLQDLHFVLS